MIEKVSNRTINRGYKNWTINMFRFYFQRINRHFYKRDNKIWLFSAWEGNKYSDNSKYLFEYVNKNIKDINCFWITKKTEIYKELKEKGYNVLLIGTKECDNIQKKAGIVFYTNGIDDFGDFPFVFGAKLICLWHSAPVIKLNYATRERHSIKILNYFANIKSYLFSYIYRDLTIATSEEAAKNFALESLTNNPIEIIGQPRNDILKNENISIYDVLSEDTINNYSINNDFHFITYMPTYRPSHNSQQELENMICSLVINQRLNDYLVNNNLKLLMKMHYLTDVSNMKFNNNIILLTEDDISDTQSLLAITDVLITDYSSCCIDFALKHKDILFWVPDFECYINENGLYDTFIKIVSDYKIISLEELINSIIKSHKNSFYSSDISNTINLFYNKNDSDTGEFSKKVADEIIRRYIDGQ